MAFLRPLVRLPFSQLVLLPRALFYVLACRVGLNISPLRMLAWSRRMQPVKPSNIPVRRLVWSVALAARRIPRATCLVQALALHRILTRAGQDSRIHIGVAKSEGRSFEAHAWVELDREVLIGGPTAASYTPIL